MAEAVKSCYRTQRCATSWQRGWGWFNLSMPLQSGPNPTAWWCVTSQVLLSTSDVFRSLWSTALWSGHICEHMGYWLLCRTTSISLLIGSICGPPAVRSSYLDIRIWYLVVRPFLWLTQWPGTHYQTTCEVHHVPLTAFAETRKLFVSGFTSV